MKRFFLLFLALGIALAAVPTFAQARERYEGRDVQPGSLLVKLRPGVSGEKVHEQAGGRVKRAYDRLGWQQIELPAGLSIGEAVGRYRKLAEVAAVEPDYLYRTSATANDPRMSQLWGMTKIGAPAAWDSTTGSNNVVVAIIDTGINYRHEDLAANMWRNPGEIAGNRVDDDQNGYVDDIYGIDPVNNDADPLDDAGHGTHVAGTIGAAGNNGLGVAGVNWSVKLLAIKFIRPDNYGSVSDAVEGYNYLLNLKRRGVNIRVANNSWSGPGFSQALKDAIDAAGNAGIVSACAAGNDNLNIDSSPDYPAAFSSPSVIAVAASDQNDRRASFSSYGATNVDLAAPGVSIISTYYSSSSAYGTMNGTSMATPHVAGAAALLAAKNPALTVTQIKSTLMSTVDKLAQWSGVVASGGRLNLARAMQSVSGTAPSPTPTASYQPDLVIRTNAATTFVGDNQYGTGQSVSQQAARGTAAIYQLRVQNEGNASDSFTITGPASGSGWTIRYYNASSGGSDITSQVTGTGWRTATLSAGASAGFRVEVIPGSTLAAGASRQISISAKSLANTAKVDTVLATTTVAATTAVSSVSLAVTPASPRPVNTAITLTASSTGSPAEYSFQIGRRSWNGWSYTTIRAYSTTPTVTWRPTAAGTYSLRVLARAVGSTKSYEALTTQTYSVTTTATTTGTVQAE